MSRTISLDLFSLLYVSQSQLAASQIPDAVNEIVETSIVSNREHGITGALLFTGDHFVQVLEGSKPAIANLMAAISRDPRHDRILIMCRSPITGRRFADWSLAYCGPSRFVADHVTRLLEAPTPAHQTKASEWLEYLLREFTTAART